MVGGTQHRLAAIFASDVVGYSRLIEADEPGTLAAMQAHRAEVWDPLTEAHRGRLVGTAGDSRLVEFPSVVSAVECAVAIQRAMVERNAMVPEEKRIRLRIGINLGDVVVDGDDIHGDGVNIAARLETQSAPDGICLSDDVVRQVGSRLDLEFADGGERELKNISKPVRVWYWPAEAPAPAAVERELTLPDYPSIAVLPFTNMSGDEEQEFFSDGITEDIITTLSKVPSLLVVARNSTFTYKGRAVDMKQVSREQGVRYVLEGSVRKAGSRVRVTAQLIDTATGHHLWAERFDRDLTDIFAVQDEVTREVVVALDVYLREGDQARIWSKGTDNIEAWECVRLGMEALNRVTRESHDEARRLFDRALQRDPNYPMAWVALGWLYFHEAESATGYNMEADRRTALEDAKACAPKALALDSDCADAYALLALCLLSQGAYDEAVKMSEKVVALAPSHAENLGIAATIMNKAGEPERAFELIQKAMRLCPIYPGWYLYVLATACRLTRRNEDAVAAFEKGLERSGDNLGLRVGLASVLGELGRIEEAINAGSEILRRNPKFSIADYISGLSYRDPAELARFEDGLRRAGLPQ